MHMHVAPHRSHTTRSLPYCAPLLCYLMTAPHLRPSPSLLPPSALLLACLPALCHNTSIQVFYLLTSSQHGSMVS